VLDGAVGVGMGALHAGAAATGFGGQDGAAEDSHFFEQFLYQAASVPCLAYCGDEDRKDEPLTAMLLQLLRYNHEGLVQTVDREPLESRC
jgi:hypothetical protein